MYYIYHIKGVKIGVSEEPDNRTRKQGFDNYEILETHTCIYLVSYRERALQKEYEYPVDSVLYFISRGNWGSKAGKVGGNTKSDLRDKKCSELGKRTGATNARIMIEKRRSYEGEGNIKCKITESQAQEILDYYTQLVNSGHRKYGLVSNVVNQFPSISKRIIVKICMRDTWKHLSPTTERTCTISPSI
jgi:hypothetical protein